VEIPKVSARERHRKATEPSVRWRLHLSIRKKSLEREIHFKTRFLQDYRPPSFAYTGPLRPAWVSPPRLVPSHIEKPDYALSGTPESENAARRESTKIYINTKDEIAGIREACRIGREVLDLAAKAVRVGVTTDEIDRVVHDATIAHNAYPSPLNYNFFPKSCCTSVNEIICHGIPDMRPLADGDIVNIDISVYYKGFHGDLNETYFVGKDHQLTPFTLICTKEPT